MSNDVKTYPASFFPPEHRVPHFCSPHWTPFRGCWNSIGVAANNLIFIEIEGKCPWQTPICSWQKTVQIFSELQVVLNGKLNMWSFISFVNTLDNILLFLSMLFQSLILLRLFHKLKTYDTDIKGKKPIITSL